MFRSLSNPDPTFRVYVTLRQLVYETHLMQTLPLTERVASCVTVLPEHASIPMLESVIGASSETGVNVVNIQYALHAHYPVVPSVAAPERLELL
jgi:uncharacterized protein involved in tolerance to divalent cations